eukprot:1519263-Rhodomonas_salina.1
MEGALRRLSRHTELLTCHNSPHRGLHWQSPHHASRIEPGKNLELAGREHLLRTSNLSMETFT